MTPEPHLKPRILLVDHDATEAGRISRFLQGEGCEVVSARTGEEAFNVLDDQGIDAIVTEAASSGIDGLRLMQVARRRDPETCVVLISDPDTVGIASRAVLDGAYDYQMRPLNLEKILAAVRRGQKVRGLVAEINDLRRRLDKKYGLQNIIGNSPAMAAVLARILQAAPTDATVLITGETGTGKELVGTALHQNSPRRNGPMIKLHCGDLSEGLVESELFGHEQGAFTGAIASRQGRFEAADGGTLFLDEVGELSASTQVKLLRVLQEREFTRVGGERPIRVDVRLIAATNHDLRGMVAGGLFREDLFYRLNVVSIEMPALRHRPQDIRPLAEHLLHEVAEAYGRRTSGFTSRAMSRMLRYRWPGNVRELKNVVTGMIINADGDRPLDVEDLPPALQEIPDEEGSLSIPLGTPLEEVERRLIESTLRASDFDLGRTAEVLGISLRTLYRRIADYQLIR